MSQAPPAERQPAPTELVSQIQASLTGVCELFFHLAGSLQRDAQPVSVTGEPAEPESGKPPRADMPQLAREVVTASRAVDALIARLPAMERNEQQQLEDIAQLMVGPAGVHACSRADCCAESP